MAREEDPTVCYNMLPLRGKHATQPLQKMGFPTEPSSPAIYLYRAAGWERAAEPVA